jgi:thiol:disulfide interchange protein DsbD
VKKTIKYALLCLICLSKSFFTFGQSPVKWSVEAKRQQNNLYILKVTGTIQEGWHVYAQDDVEEGLESVRLTFDNELVETGKLEHSDRTITIKDDLFEGKFFEVYEGTFAFDQYVKITGSIPSSLKINLVGFASNDSEFVPLQEESAIVIEGGRTDKSNPQDRIVLSSVDLKAPAAECGKEEDGNSSIWNVFFLGLIGGLLALLTPCVFPMIPLTVSWFTSQSGNKKAAVRNGIIYGVFIVGIYLLCSLPFHLLTNVNPELFNVLSTNLWVNIFFFAVFIFFALSFFGLFEITLSGNLSNKADSKSGLGSLTGIFFMALTLALVSFSCTGPILGTLLVGSLSSNSGAWQLTAGMGGFGIALGLPFALFAMFPGWMQRLPKSGGWLMTVKKTLAFVELALAFKFLSNADLVAHWGLLKREIFIGIWILIAFFLALYLLGLFDKREDRAKIGKVRISLGILALIFTLYLLPGMTNTKYARLSLLSGFPPPMSYSVYAHKTSGSKTERVEPQFVNNYKDAIAMSKQTGKPVLLDFTGWACVNCRKMEENIWTRPEVAELIKTKFILVSLYVDDRAKLPVDERFTYTGKSGLKKEIRTTGDLWATFQSVNFSQVTQPLYVILSPDERLLNHPVGYTPDEAEYKAWLECGLNAASFK